MASLWTDAAVPATVTDTETRAVQLGVKFRANVDGAITGIRFYKGPQNTGAHVGKLWTATGQELATATFANETASGWQQVNFTSPVPIQANTTYVASYHAPNGRYSIDQNYFSQAHTNGPLTAPASSGGNGNGVYRYGAATAFPNQTFRASNYWVDVVFQEGATDPNNTPPVARDDSASTNEDTVLRLAPATLIANDTDANGDALSIVSVGGATNGSVTRDATSGDVVFTPQANYNGAASFTYTISDGKGGSATATVAVTVEPVNDPPVANNDSGFTTPANTALTIPATTLLSNDTDVDNPPSSLSIASVGNATNGGVALSESNVVFTPNAGHSGPASFTYTVTDGAATSNAATVSLTVGTATQPSNPVVTENERPGNPRSEWDLNIGASSTIEGYAAQFSVDQGQTVDFKIRTPSTNYRVDIYRLGYYGGAGARKVATINRTLPQAQTQPNPLRDSATGLVDAGNWSVSASWAVPADAVSGVYIAKLVRQDGTSGENHILFIVRDDDGRSDMIFQTADTTWQAYNEWGGNSLYTGSPAGRAYKVSYNRPFTTRQGGASTGPRDFLFDSEYPMIRWLEANGYNVSYLSGIDSDRFGGELREHKAFLSVGHDEYWSGQQRANVEAARDAGVNLAFFSGNEVFWKTRWENSIDPSNTPYRTLVSYKETHANAKIDPSSEWTGTWRDPRFSPPSDGGRPENALTGTIFTVNNGSQETIRVPGSYGDLRFWRNTPIANLSSGQTATLSGELLSYEWDEDLDNGHRPAGLIRLSSTVDNNAEVIKDYGSTYGPGSATHALTLYRDDSGALVFGAGTTRWAWGLDGTHDYDMAHGGSIAAAVPDARVRQATVNLFADMGVQPATLQSGLARATASTDTTKPISTVTSPTAGSSIPSGQAVTISGTASDTGGVVGGVEVSTDGGATWRPATGRSNWSYNWTPQSSGAYTIKSRAVDDTLNMETPGAGITVNVGASTGTGPYSLWSNAATPTTVTDPDATAVELGVKFRANVAGQITGLRFYKGPQNTGTHTGKLWSATGAQLASATFANETASGWQQVNFANPVQIQANTTYVASYYTPSGKYSVDENYFSSSLVNGPLTALADGMDGGNGVYRYGSSGFPTDTFNKSNYWVDVVFQPSASLAA